MVGLLITLIFCSISAVVGARCLMRFAPNCSAFEAVGVGGSLVLGASGLLMLLLGFFSIQLALFAPVLVICGAFFLGKRSLDFKSFWPFLKQNWLMSAFFLLLVGFCSISVLAPCDMRDWDSLAYHFAVPKLWLSQGKVGFVPAIHHSNFPFTADMLYVLGLKWGGVAGAKAFNLCWMLLGSCGLFGIARRWYGSAVAWIAPVAFAVTPVILWESGTGYIDIPHGLFCGLATLYFAELLSKESRTPWWLFGTCLGFALGTKHTGLQFFLAIGFVGAICVFALRQKAQAKGVGMALGLALLIAMPWYVKSVAYTGNPVFPFFYKQLGGKDWNQWRADIYSGEQRTFGVGTSPIEVGNAVLGLAYQPGRYVNPGQTEGRGFPTGAIGFIGLLAGLLWLCSGRARGREQIVLASLGVVMLMWFVLSQQSRYLTAVVVPLSILAVGAASVLPWKKLLTGATCLQAGYSLWMMWSLQTQTQLLVASGAVSADDYQTAAVPFYSAAKSINELTGEVKIALYDEVFGFYLDKPYMWANPGHSTLIPYETTENGEQFSVEMKKLGFTHVYLNFQVMDKADRARWIEAMTSREYTAEERKAKRDNPDLWWRVLVADAVRRGDLRPVKFFPDASAPRSALFEFTR